VSEPRACDECLRRAWLVESLSPSIERTVGEGPPSRSRELLALPDDQLSAAVAPRQPELFVERSRERDPARLREAIRGAHAWACCRHQRSYPALLADLRDAPAVLFGRGDPALLARLERRAVVTVVGSRRPSGYGREMATRLGEELAMAGLVVVSGMALGIDSCAHRGALAAGGLTVSVLGSGPDVPYPLQMRPLYDDMIEAGLVLSELPPGAGARRWTFPARNRIMAALGAMTVVVEARNRSGSLITAAIASDLGRDIGAVPGLVGSSPAAGTNWLLRDGAQVIRDGQDVLDALLGVGTTSSEARPGPRLDPELARVLDLVEEGAVTQDAVARASELGPGAVAAALTRLELLGLLSCDAAGRYRRTTLAVEPAA
jgi:DNA processing protein